MLRFLVALLAVGLCLAFCAAAPQVAAPEFGVPQFGEASSGLPQRSAATSSRSQAPEPQSPEQSGEGLASRSIGTMFRAYDVWVDGGDQQVAAWQVTLADLPGQVVGVEGGVPKAFADAPAYDPRALHQPKQVARQLILAALGAEGEAAPSGRFRAARVHLRMPLGPMPAISVLRAVGGDPTGARLAITIECTPVEVPR